eukprot:GGOE01041265.1.p1 GENE.GGOE01041265.1~~GGOE01041265.1.p1  ORF type:complete len:413 (-),score=83.58 GGOE01041265.1:115-1353(-)
MHESQTLYDLVRMALLVDEAHLLLDTSSVSSLPWQAWIQITVAHALTLSRTHCPLFAITPDTTIEELGGFISSYDIAKKQITERAEIAHRQTVGLDCSANFTELQEVGKVRKETDVDAHSTPRMDPESRLLHPSILHLSLEESTSFSHHRQHSVASTFNTPKGIPRLRDRALSEVYGAEAVTKRFAVLICHLHRASPTVQQCLLTALEHCQVTVGGASVHLTGNLTVVATMEDVAAVGHELRERFMLASFVSPTIVHPPIERTTQSLPPLWDCQQRLAELSKTVEAVTISPAVESYLRRLIAVVRQSPAVGFEFPNWRVTRHLTAISKAYAVLQQRDFVVPSDVSAVALHTLPHRLNIAEGVTLDEYLWGSVALMAHPCSTDASSEEDLCDASLHRRLQLVEGLLAGVALPL